jgi:hypothetical protein
MRHVVTHGTMALAIAVEHGIAWYSPFGSIWAWCVSLWQTWASSFSDHLTMATYDALAHGRKRSSMREGTQPLRG